jgi:hypothetical protein
MNYEKLTVERFALRLQENAYKGLTGARRAIGKTDWSKKDKERAHELADKTFGAGGKVAKSVKTAAPKKAAAAKKVSVPKKAAGKKRVAAALAPVQSAVAAPAKPQAGSPRAAYAKARAKLHAVPSARTPVFDVVVPPGPPILEEVTRQNSASAVISAYRNSGPLNALEQRAYDVATAEYAENASKAALRIVRVASQGFPTPTPLEQTGEGDDVVPGTAVAPVASFERNLSGPAPGSLTPDEMVQYARLEKGAAAIPAILGQGNTTPSS